MSWSMFIDEPGDHQYSLPYGALTGVAVKDSHVSDLAKRLKAARAQYNALRPTNNILCERLFSSLSCLSNDDNDGKDSDCKLHSSMRSQGINARMKDNINSLLDQIGIGYFRFCLELAQDYNTAAFAIIIPSDCINLRFSNRLRKDYSFLFERFFYFLQSKSDDQIGYIFSSSNSYREGCIDSCQVSKYFLNTTKGRLRSRLIIPDILYCRGLLSEIIYLSRIVTYVVSFGVRLPNMDIPRNLEISELVKICNSLRFSYISENGKKDWSFKFVGDLSVSALER